MHTTIISIWVLMAMAYTQTPDGCTEYCNLLLFDELRLFWRPDCVCALEYQRTVKRHKKPTKIKRNFSPDNSAVYYEPSADEYPFHRTSFVDYPYYITNPMYHTQSIKNTDIRKTRKIPTDNLDHNKKKNGSFKKRLPKESVFRTFDIEAEDSPLYLDIDIYKSNQNERSNFINENDVTQIGLTEDDLIECIDLQVLVFFRKNHQDAAVNINDMLDETKINKYKDLTDSDLMIEIQSKCHQPIKIIDESLQQIKNSWPRKSQLRSSQDIETVKSFKNYHNENKTLLVNVTEASTRSYSATEMIIDRELGNMIITPSTEELTETVSPLPTNIYSKVLDYSNFSSNFNSSKIISTNSFEIKSLKETTPEIIKSNTERIKYLRLYTETDRDRVSYDEIDLRKDSLSQNSINFLTMTFESTTMVDPIYTNFETLPNSAIKTQTDILLADYSTSKPILRDQHIAMNEKDIKIPRIITKEIKNNTVVSNINGIEIIPNNDFVETTVPNQDLTNEYTYETTTTIFGSTETILFYDLLKNSSKNSLGTPSHFKNLNVTFTSSNDLKSNKSYNNEEESTEPNLVFKIYNSTITNNTQLNELLLHNNLTLKNNENKQNKTGYLIMQYGSTQIQSSNEAQTIIPEIITFLPEIHNNYSEELHSKTIQQTDKNNYLEDEEKYPNNNLTQILYNTDKNGTEINKYLAGKDTRNVIHFEISTTIPIETQGDSWYLSGNDTANTSLSFQSINDSDKNKSSQDLTTESWSFTSVKKDNSENSTNFSTILDKMLDSESFNNKTPKTESSTNYVQTGQELFTVKKTTNKSKDVTNFPVNQDLSPTTTVDYPNTTEAVKEFTQYHSGHSGSSELVSYLSIPNTTPSREDTTPSSQNVSLDISEYIHDFILGKNNTHGSRYSPTTDDPRSPNTSVISITNTTENIKKDILFGLTSQNIVGKLYFLFGEKQVPARFVQNSDGQINLGFDGETICDKLTQKDSNDSVIIEAICNCSRYKNCTKIS